MSWGNVQSGAPLGPLVELLVDVLQRLHAVQAGPALTALNESGLTLPQMITLPVLRTEGAHTVGAIATRVRLSAAAASHLVDRLVQLGLVDRVEHAHDRRRKHVSLSRKGQVVAERLNRARVEGLASGLERLSLRTRSRLADVLGDMRGDLGGPGPLADGPRGRQPRPGSKQRGASRAMRLPEDGR